MKCNIMQVTNIPWRVALNIHCNPSEQLQIKYNYKVSPKNGPPTDGDNFVKT